MSGGGVDPDVNVSDEPLSKLAIALYTKNYLFDYATVYAKSHPTLPPASTFSITDADFSNFSKWLEGKDYAYKTETDIALDSLKSAATREMYYDAIKTDLSALQVKVAHDKQQDLLKRKSEITRLLENEIVSRYYYQKGRIEQSLRTDNDVEKALALISQPSQYGSYLQKK
jgi:carboxyl-terminal processing protease